MTRPTAELAGPTGAALTGAAPTGDPGAAGHPGAAGATGRRSVLRPEDREFLDAQRVGRLATSGADGAPHVVPVCFVHADGRLYVAVDAKPKRGDPRSLRRLRNLRERPEAVLLVDHYEEDWRRLRWLAIRCRAAILEDGAERAAALAALERRYPQYAAMGLAELGLPVIALRPVAVRRWSAAPDAAE